MSERMNKLSNLCLLSYSVDSMETKLRGTSGCDEEFRQKRVHQHSTVPPLSITGSSLPVACDGKEGIKRIVSRLT